MSLLERLRPPRPLINSSLAFLVSLSLQSDYRVESSASHQPSADGQQGTAVESIENRIDEYLQQALPGGRIVYVSENDGQEDIFVVGLDGKDQKRLTDDKNSKRNLKPIQDGRGVVYNSLERDNKKRGIVLLDLQNGSREQLTSASAGDVFDSCPAPDGEDGVVFSRFETHERKNASNDLFRVDLKTKNVERLTQDNIGSSEECPVVSPDGKRIAFNISFPGQPRHKAGIIVYDREQIKGSFDPQKTPEYPKGTMPLGWAPDSQELMYIDFGSGENELYVSGQGKTRLIAKGVFGASWSPDGKWILTANRLPGKQSAQLGIVPASGGEIKFLGLEGLYPVWVGESEPVRRNVDIVFGMITEIVDGYERHEISLPFESRLQEPDFRYRIADILRFSLGGWLIDAKRGFYLPKDQKCTDTLESLDTLGNKYLQFLRDVKTLEPRRDMITVTQSLGGPIVLNALLKIMRGKADFDVRGMRFILTHGPNMGVSKPGLGFLGQIWGGEMPEGCRILFGATPPPSILAYPAGRELLDMWENREKRREELKELTAWLGKRESSIVTLNNYEDCILFARGCLIPREMLELEFLKERFLGVLLSQEIPGAINIWRFLGKEGLGHDRYWRSEEGLAILTQAVGAQRGEIQGH